MKRINSLSDLLMKRLAVLLNVESQLVEALPKMALASESLALKRILADHLEITKGQARRLEGIFSGFGKDPQRVLSKVMKDLIQESEDIAKNTENGQARDIAIISVMRRIKQYEISRYLPVSEHAGDLGYMKMVGSLDETINEERAMNLHLSELAQGMINVQASGGFYIPEGKFKRGGIKKKGTDVSRFISEGNPNIQEDSDKGKG